MKAHVLVLVCVFGAAVAANASVIDVNWDGSGDYATIQEAVDAAGPGDTLLVAAGTYSGSLNREISFSGKDVYLVSEDGAESTIIDCGNAGRAFVVASGEGPDLIIEGFTIRNGYGSDDIGPERWGGAIYCAYSYCTVLKCHFEDCDAGYGGAIYAGISAIMDIISCEFEGNTADSYGGSIYTYASDVEIAKCDFYDGWAGINGGAVCCKTGTLVAISTCDFIGNSSAQGGAVYIGTFDNGGTEPEDPSEIYVCNFRHNTAMNGGAVFINGFTWVNAAGCEFDYNTATGNGGAIFALTDYSRALTVQNCTFCFNGADHGGGVYAAGVFGFQMNVENSIFAFGEGGASVQAEDYGTVSVRYCIAFGNRGGDDFPGNSPTNFDLDPLFCDVFNGNYYHCSNSPCLPSIHPYGRPVGAHYYEYTTCGDCASPVEEASWGSIKAMYR